ncbi:type I-D CRISPR-associated protein Cas5/Csc1 [Halanaerobacter jeridensis]|uniref:CRISPR-associated protein Csc1 n=1 Tax=Halanaerobacter jeridensis TaxID=706427 RepID=A0A938XQD0_9FIRM|nr:type I-D CRISPR-associated protein Cas5/Csc1 [Halanaerobacter jeridensis]MBM7555644.1 CRISPR-associated protein Csc1 [Halanaerobacter jeridensis]
MVAEDKLYYIEFELLENTFFASREIYNYYETEAVIGHFALAYALGLCQSPYTPTKKPLYQEHFTELNEKGIYITPATVMGDVEFVIQTFNTLSDSYWYQFKSNAVETDRNKGRTYASNFPQQGRAKMLAVGNKFSFYLLSKETISLPRYMRLGKFMSKARLEITEVDYQIKEVEEKKINRVLSPLDLDEETELHSYDTINIRPTPLIKNSILSGPMLYISDNQDYLPLNMNYEV